MPVALELSGQRSRTQRRTETPPWFDCSPHYPSESEVGQRGVSRPDAELSKGTLPVEVSAIVISIKDSSLMGCDIL